MKKLLFLIGVGCGITGVIMLAGGNSYGIIGLLGALIITKSTMI